MPASPVERLSEILVADLDDDWQFSACPERDLLGVAPGTISALLYQIQASDLWDALFEVAATRPDQWLVDLSEFFPAEEQFIPALFRMLCSATTVHARVCHAQESADWPWGATTMCLVPKVMAEVRAVRQSVSGSGSEVCESNLRLVEARLEAMTAGVPPPTQEPSQC